MKVVLFLCTGNYYRSRFAEELFKFEAPIECPGWTAVSRGIAVDLGVNNVGPIARSTVQVLQNHGISLDPLLARMPLQLKIADLESAHHIVALKKAEHFP
jgi:protein-tyrosine phosphatase